jgi:signal transduction histidine kinase
MTDRNGVSIGREKLRIARNGGGFWYYVYDNPDAGSRPDFKVSYFMPAGDDWMIGSGMYLPEVNAGFTDSDRDALVAKVKEAVAFVKEHGRGEAVREFNDPNGTFSDPMMYIFAFDYNGTLLANPFLPGIVGVNRMTDQDPYGSNPPGQMIANAENGGGFAYYFFADPADGYKTTLKLAYTEPADGIVVGSGIFIEK